MIPQNCKYFPLKAKFPENEMTKFLIVSMHGDIMTGFIVNKLTLDLRVL